MTHPEDAPPKPARQERPRWAPLTDEQRDIAAELVARAEQLRANANADEDDQTGLSLREAVRLAAIQMGLEP